jgi:uncharacterized protein YcfL
MKKILIVLILLLMLIGCGESSGRSNISNKTTDERLVIVESTSDYAIAVDKKTKVMYTHFYRGGATVMIDENGNPLLWEGELE